MEMTFTNGNTSTIVSLHSIGSCRFDSKSWIKVRRPSGKKITGEHVGLSRNGLVTARKMICRTLKNKMVRRLRSICWSKVQGCG
ncbi:hypothetical protein Y032_0149g2727 [Ancylostoma ceylanicum]|uniref:Uncharacterized protein n=1 Tax=Ancylostoma ceylanicum TaxID=53326 RepID=A0A016T1V1_9BILA|nr:hypothetical protein Y032_0149g2727 [Ancylostoma ceylanicum]